MYIAMIKRKAVPGSAASRHTAGWLIHSHGVAVDDLETAQGQCELAVKEYPSCLAWVMEFDPPDYVPPLKLVRDSRGATA